MIRLRAILGALLLLLAAAVLPGGSARAHVTELAVLKVTEIAKGAFRITWELKPNTDITANLEPIFPPHCKREDLTLDCGEKGLVGALSFEGIGQGQSAAMFKLSFRDGSTQLHTLTPSRPIVQVSENFSVASWEGLQQIGLSYLSLGVEHIMLGIDHLLFVLGLIWISRSSWMLFKTITAFTVAHTVTLGAVTFGWVGVPENFVNAMIALSIVFIGVEVLHARQGRSTVTLRNPWAVSFFFGLLHGFGFANALLALGLPEQAVPLALVAFNLGVEIGQIAFVFGVLALAWAYRAMRVFWPQWSVAAVAYVIGGVGALWFFQRTVTLLTA